MNHDSLISANDKRSIDLVSTITTEYGTVGKMGARILAVFSPTHLLKLIHHSKGIEFT
jgi:hypothetical protein